MTDIVFDCETDGLNPTRIWCVVAQVLGGEEHVFTERDSFAQFVEENAGATWYAHNGIGFDYGVLANLWGISIQPEKQRDTLVLSRLASPSRSGGHSLRNWGNTLGYPKGDHTDWSHCSDEMLEYCARDVRITVDVLRAVQHELSGFDDRAIVLEHEVARLIAQQETNGWLLDEGKCFVLLAELKEKKLQLEETVHRRFKPRCKAVKEVVPTKTKAGSWALPSIRYLGADAVSIVGGKHTRVEFPEFNLGSRKQIGEYLQWFGWKPTAFTETGQPKVDERVLTHVKDVPEAQLIADYLTVEKRIAMIQGWLDALQDDGRVHGRVNSNGAVTGRMTHYEPNMAQVTSGSKIYGKEMRECWIAPEGYSIVGMDASGLELRMLAHYMDDPAYTQELLDGDIHTVNQQNAGLPTRDSAKTFIYAFLYGAGDAKIGSIIGGSKKEGRQLKEQFLSNTPALAALKDRVGNAAKRGWLKGLDGRRMYVRSQHSALNTLLQGAGAVVMKQALVRLDRMATAHNLDYKLVGNIHDEIQTEVKREQAEKFGKLAAYAVTQAGTDFNLRCPLAGDYKIGLNWAQTH